MKTIKLLSLFTAAILALNSCSSDDDPEPVNEEEVITTMTITLVPQSGGAPIQLESRDLDGDGPNPPEITVSGNFSARTLYTGSIVLLNETETPAENITTEVEEEAEEHQFFYTLSPSLSGSTEYINVDGDGNPLGTEFAFSAGDESTGTMTFTLRHDLKKPNDGTLSDAGGETDIAQTFDVVIE
ncbi:type 1 periplasmic binding fold superfamily protein [Robiginitalea aurantiaca]|uniref:Type 1 periplasmic binding fold superfamily protein n=1 Tax=Robiginitalea aurantiaca TaxID=3056915 RepID=A0ABT7WI38_9FLAO|nr:type 1 periplasmic binding fold superfamily protein [Robiginitalea aurantiaca]MDM9632597.1 type 1 periplasmic binding fold superfamily protein [Robiginitalea aurantiaca]